jgi:hypothetical protein
MSRFLLSVLLVLPIHAQAALTPMQCSQVSDMLYALLAGQRFPVPEWSEAVLRRAIDHTRANQHQQDPYWHSTTLFLECVRTGGQVDQMYDAKKMTDPTKVPTST